MFISVDSAKCGLLNECRWLSRNWVEIGCSLVLHVIILMAMHQFDFIYLRYLDKGLRFEKVVLIRISLLLLISIMISIVVSIHGAVLLAQYCLKLVGCWSLAVTIALD